MSFYNKFTLPIGDALIDALGMITGRWRLFFQNQLSLNNSLTTRWHAHIVAGITTLSATSFKASGAEWTTDLYPTGSRVMLIDSGDRVYGVVDSCTYNGGAVEITWSVTMDKGRALSSVTRIYYGELTSSVID